MAQDDKGSKEKDVFEKTAEVANVSDVQEEEVVKLNLPSNSSKKFKSKSLKVECGIPGCKAKPMLAQNLNAHQLLIIVHMSVCHHNLYQYDPVAL